MTLEYPQLPSPAQCYDLIVVDVLASVASRAALKVITRGRRLHVKAEA